MLEERGAGPIQCGLHSIAAGAELLLSALGRLAVASPARSAAGRHCRLHLLVSEPWVGLMTELEGTHRHMVVDDGMPGGQEGSPHVGDVVAVGDARPVGQQEVEAQGVSVHPPGRSDGHGDALPWLSDAGDGGADQVVVGYVARCDPRLGGSLRPVSYDVVDQGRVFALSGRRKGQLSRTDGLSG